MTSGDQQDRQGRLHPHPYVELHLASAFSFLRGASSPEALVARAVALGMCALALTDYMSLAGVVRFQAACTQYGIQPIVGVELAVAEPVFGIAPRPAHLVVLAENATGYARLCRLLTAARLARPDVPIISWNELKAEPDGLILLSGGRDGTLMRLLLAGKRQEADQVAHRYHDAFGSERAYIELQHHRLLGSLALLRQLTEVAQEAGLRCLATNGVQYATREGHAVYNLMTCIRLGISVDQPHAERPRNDEAHLKSGSEMVTLFAHLPHGRAAVSATSEIAARCHLALLKAACTAPQVPLPAGVSPTSHLRALCETGLHTRYATQPEVLQPASPQRRQLDHELAVITQLELEEFFLCVHDIMHAARVMGIRVSGRGSAANSITAYLLGITGVDPIHHKLLFERFLNPDRAGMPDIDVDVQSDRRDELIRYVERTYTEAHTAMVANVITYRARSAIRDVAKALGYPLELVNRLTKLLPHHADAEELQSYEEDLRQVVAALPDESIGTRCLKRLPYLLETAPKLLGLPRHLSLHNGGMVLTREPLSALVPVRISANGVRALEIDKDDVERLGLIKFDLLGLRTLGAVEEALTLIERSTGTRPDIDHLCTTPPDPRAMDLICKGQTLAVFQIESPGQWHLLAQTQPTTFNDLIVQTALFRPGPIQGGFVHPYLERRREKQAAQDLPATRAKQPDQSAHGTRAARSIGQQRLRQREAVQTPWHGAPADDFWTAHPVLAPILAESEGILLFQEQILEIAHRFAGLSYAEADGFRRAMTHQRSPREMEAMRQRFVGGARACGEIEEAADRVFDALSAFVGYGFSKAHAGEFARTIYQTAWLKAYYPAHYLAAFLAAQPAGYFPPHVVVEEAKYLGIPVLPVHVNYSEDRFTAERIGSPGHERWAIRIGLRQIAKVGDQLAKAILFARRLQDEAGHMYERPFTSLWDVLARLRPVGLTREAAEALVWSGACDGLTPRMERRQRLWQLREFWPLVDPHPKGARHARPRDTTRRRTNAVAATNTTFARPQQLTLTWEMPLGAPADVLPTLPALTAVERDALDYQLLGMSTRPHPMRHYRRLLDRRGILRIADLADISAGCVVHVAGWPISAQRPPTAHGVGFVVLEDETGRLPLAMAPALAAELRRILRDARYLIAVGRLERVRWYRSLWAFELHGVTGMAAAQTG